MRNKRSPVLTCCPSVKLRSLMKPEIRATTSTLSIATTRPITKMHAATRNRPASLQLLTIYHSRTSFTHSMTPSKNKHLNLFRRFKLGIQGYLRIEYLRDWARRLGDQFGGCVARALQLKGKRHGKASGMCSSDQFFRVCTLLVFKARLVGIWRYGQDAGIRRKMAIACAAGTAPNCP